MEEEDENTYVLVVVKDEEKDANVDVLTYNRGSAKAGDIIETTKPVEDFDVDVKVEPEDKYEDCESEYIEYEFLENFEVKDEPCTPEPDEYIDEDENAVDVKELYEGHSIEDIKYEIQRERLAHSNKGPKKYLRRIPKSMVEELRQRYKELRHDEAKLVSAVEQMMRDTKPPDPPRDYFLINGIMFECVECGNMSGTLPAAHRHYNQKHGPRYLLCYACGDDFRSSINLYKHEKRCRAADAHVVLKARAAIVGSKGRGRPFLSHATDKPFHMRAQKKPQPKIRSTVVYPCSMCSASFSTKANQQSHENMHRGERPFRCQNCPRAYTNLSALTRHAKTHSNECFICDYCNRSFKCKQILKYHLNTHDATPKYGCPECDRRFAQNSALKLHINTVHRNLPPPCACEVCPKRFPRMTLLKYHMKREHGLKIITREMFYKMLPTMTESELQSMQPKKTKV